MGTAGRWLQVGSEGGPKHWEVGRRPATGYGCVFSSTPWESTPARLPSCSTLLLRQDQCVASGPVTFRNRETEAQSSLSHLLNSSSSCSYWQRHPRNKGAAPPSFFAPPPRGPLARGATEGLCGPGVPPMAPEHGRELAGSHPSKGPICLGPRKKEVSTEVF